MITAHGEEVPDDPEALGRHYALEEFAAALDDLIDEHRDILRHALEGDEVEISDEDWEIALTAFDALILQMHTKTFEAVKDEYKDH